MEMKEVAEASAEQQPRSPLAGSVTRSVSVGLTNIMVRLPPPPDAGSRSRPASVGFEVAGAGARGSTATDGSSAPSSQRSSGADGSGIETMALKRSARGQMVGSNTHHLDMLMDEDELTRNDPSKDDLEGFIQR